MSTKLTVMGGVNLFQIAADYLGRAQDWNIIAQRNGLVDPWITTTTPIILDIPDSILNASTDGVYTTT